MNTKDYMLIGICAIISAFGCWYLYQSNKREQIMFEQGRKNSEYFMDRLKIQDMERGL